MQKLFDASVLALLRDGIKKGYWSLEDLDTPPPGWTECVNSTRGNKAFPQGYQGVKYKNLARVETPKPKQEKVELTDPKDLPTSDS
tara:strand:- start:221 stop:478 length:258 start_codon:yes stop_codon:yes gene_type:complete